MGLYDFLIKGGKNARDNIKDEIKAGIKYEKKMSHDREPVQRKPGKTYRTYFDDFGKPIRTEEFKPKRSFWI